MLWLPIGKHQALQIRKLIMRVPKFGNDEDYVDFIVKDVFDSYLELLPQYKTLRTGKGPVISCYTMSTSNITSYVPNGFDVLATQMAAMPVHLLTKDVPQHRELT